MQEMVDVVNNKMSCATTNKKKKLIEHQVRGKLSADVSHLTSF